jgi:hypothetical protein
MTRRAHFLPYACAVLRNATLRSHSKAAQHSAEIRHVFAGMRKKCNRQEPSLEVIVIASMTRPHSRVRAGRDMHGWLAPLLFCGAVDVVRAALSIVQPSCRVTVCAYFQRKGANR